MTQASDAVVSHLKSAKQVLITTHVRPDGDALGSTAALWAALTRIGVSARVILLSHLPSKYAFVYSETGVDYFDVEAGFPADFSLDAYDTLCVVDTGTWSQLPGMKDRVEAFRGKVLVVDHHLTQEPWGTARWVETSAAAAGEIVAQLIDQLGTPIDAKMAAALYLALVSDTGWFQFSNTTAGTMRLAARLLEAGVDADQLYQWLYQSERSQRLALQSRALQSMQLLAGERVAITLVRREDFAATGAAVTDTEALVNQPLQIKTVQASIVLTEPPEGGAIRVSARSKGQIDCSALLQAFGGGGHARAAGAKIEGELEAVRDRVQAAVLAKVEPVAR